MKNIKINSTLFHTWPWISGNPSGAWSPIQIIASLDFFSICQLISSLKRPPFQSVIPKDPEERKAYLLSIPTPDDWSPRSSRFTLRTDENGPSSWAGNFWRSYSCLPLVPPRPWVRWHAHSEPLPDRIWGSLDRKTNSQLPSNSHDFFPTSSLTGMGSPWAGGQLSFSSVLFSSMDGTLRVWEI